MTDPVIIAAAHAVAEVEADERRTSAALAKAQQNSANIHTRIANLEAERAGIVSRRAGGRHLPDDGGALALIAADLEGLAGLQAEAEAQLTAVRAPAEDASRAVASARFQLAQARDGAVAAHLVGHLRELDRAMVAALTEMDAVTTRLGRGGPPPWGASGELTGRLRKLASLRHEL